LQTETKKQIGHIPVLFRIYFPPTGRGQNRPGRLSKMGVMRQSDQTLPNFWLARKPSRTHLQPHRWCSMSNLAMLRHYHVSVELLAITQWRGQ